MPNRLVRLFRFIETICISIPAYAFKFDSISANYRIFSADIKYQKMKILVSVENDINLEALKNKLCAVISSFDQSELYIDVFHVHSPPDIQRVGKDKELVDEINKNEFSTKLRMISKCENELEAFIQEKLGIDALVNSFVLKGDYKEKLKEHIIFQRYDLLVLNPTKKKDYDVILKGRNTHWVIDNLEIPVLILPSYIDYSFNGSSDVTCFVDSLESFNSINQANVLNMFKSEIVDYIHFGKDSFHEKVRIINSSNPLQSISEYTKDDEHLNIYTLHHKRQGDFLNLLDKSFTKHILKSLGNPLLIF